jgi:uncharacterized protein (DUF1697 family)
MTKASKAKNCLYSWYGDSFGRRNLAASVSKISTGTTRNWKTVEALAMMIKN